MIEKADFDSISIGGSTRYGTSMRGSSLDSRSAGPYRNIVATTNQTAAVTSNEGFGKFTTTSDFGMQ